MWRIENLYVFIDSFKYLPRMFRDHFIVSSCATASFIYLRSAKYSHYTTISNFFVSKIIFIYLFMSHLIALYIQIRFC